MKQPTIWRWLKHWSLKCYQTPPIAHKVFFFSFIRNGNHMSRSSPQVQPDFLSYQAGKLLSRRKVVSRVDLDQTDRTLLSVTLSFRNNTMSQSFQDPRMFYCLFLHPVLFSPHTGQFSDLSFSVFSTSVRKQDRNWWHMDTFKQINWQILLFSHIHS